MEELERLQNLVGASYVLAKEPKHLLFGLSGGADSIALASILKTLQRIYKFKLTCIHVNHGLRQAAEEDENFVINICESWNLPLIVKHVKIPSKSNIESNAREERYKAFYEVKEKVKADCLVLGHHMDDQAETVIMRLMHGTGPTGLAAMREFSNGIWRPLLHVRRYELIQYLNHFSIGWIEDDSNLDFRFLRNALRHRVIPVLEELSSSSIQNIAKTSVLFADEEDYWSDFSLCWLKERACLDPSNPFLNLKDFDTLHIAVKRRILRCFCAVLNVKLDMAQTQRLIELLNGSGHQSVNLPQEVKAIRSAGRLHLVSAKKNLIRLGNLEETMDEKLGNRRIESFDCERLLGAVLRYRLRGDRISPLGCHGSQSLSKYLIDRKMDRPFREHWPILAIGQDVLWVVGFGMAQTAAIKSNTKRICTLSYVGILPDETEIEKKG
ncbi:MAG: tRNA lysidine(34) synthetase TilS [Clostridiales bacterium]|nr:tRNA lysidine(34) synthetase TilS [Clostridiales bacterium]